MGRSSGKASTASVSYRCADDLSEVARDWTAAEIDQLAGATPWRTFRWHRGQKHYAGTGFPPRLIGVADAISVRILQTRSQTDRSATQSANLHAGTRDFGLSG